MQKFLIEVISFEELSRVAHKIINNFKIRHCIKKSLIDYVAFLSSTLCLFSFPPPHCIRLFMLRIMFYGHEMNRAELSRSLKGGEKKIDYISFLS